MQTELELLQPQLVVAAAENEKMLVIIQRESKDVETASERVYRDCTEWHHHPQWFS